MKKEPSKLRSLVGAALLLGSSLLPSFSKAQNSGVVSPVREDLTGCTMPARAPYYKGDADTSRTPAEYRTWFLAHEDTLRKCYEANLPNYKARYDINWDFDMVLNRIKNNHLHKIIFPAGTEFTAMSYKVDGKVHVAENPVCYQVPVAGFVVQGFYLIDKKDPTKKYSYVGFMHCGQHSALPPFYQKDEFFKEPEETPETPPKLYIYARILEGKHCADLRSKISNEMISVDVKRRNAQKTSSDFHNEGILAFDDSKVYIGTISVNKGDTLTVLGDFPQNNDIDLTSITKSFVMNRDTNYTLLFCEKGSEEIEQPEEDRKDMWFSFSGGRDVTEIGLDYGRGYWTPGGTPGYGTFYGNIPVYNDAGVISSDTNSIQFTGDATNGEVVTTVNEYGGQQLEFVINDVTKPQEFTVPFQAYRMALTRLNIGMGKYVPMGEKWDLSVGGRLGLNIVNNNGDHFTFGTIAPVVGVHILTPVFKGFDVSVPLSWQKNDFGHASVNTTAYVGGKSWEVGLGLSAQPFKYEMTNLPANVSSTVNQQIQTRTVNPGGRLVFKLNF